MTTIKQTQVGECGHACLAMILNLSLKNIIKDLPQWGLNDTEMIEYLRSKGKRARSVTDWLGQCESAILTVPSLNNIGLLHYIIWDSQDKKYRDPSTGPLQYDKNAPIDPRNKTTKLISWASAIIW